MILTKSKKAKAERDAQICKEYKELQQSGSKPYAIVDHLTDKYGISANTIYRVTEKIR